MVLVASASDRSTTLGKWATMWKAATAGGASLGGDGPCHAREPPRHCSGRNQGLSGDGLGLRTEWEVDGIAGQGEAMIRAHPSDRAIWTGGQRLDGSSATVDQTYAATAGPRGCVREGHRDVSDDSFASVSPPQPTGHVVAQKSLATYARPRR
jgi:hypothetical protein